MPTLCPWVALDHLIYIMQPLNSRPDRTCTSIMIYVIIRAVFQIQKIDPILQQPAQPIIGPDTSEPSATSHRYLRACFSCTTCLSVKHSRRFCRNQIRCKSCYRFGHMESNYYLNRNKRVLYGNRFIDVPKLPQKPIVKNIILMGLLIFTVPI